MAHYFEIHETDNTKSQFGDNDKYIDSIGLEKGLKIDNAQDAARAYFHRIQQPYTTVWKGEYGSAIFKSEGKLYRFIPA